MTLNLDPYDLGWIVGVMEGEGWFGVRNGRPVAQLIMTDEDVVLRMAELTGLGNVTGPHQPTDGIRKPYWKWAITARDVAADFMAALRPYMGTRRQKRIDEILALYAAAGPTKGTAPTCSRGHNITPESGNLKIMTDAAGYVRRRCLACQALRQRDYRSRKRNKL